VPIGVSTESGVVMDGGIGVVIFIFGGAVCVNALPKQPKRTANIKRLMFELWALIYRGLLD
jgi:hypothetical protein